MNEILEKISNAGIVPVVVIEDADNAVKTVEALSNGGIDVAEVTFRTDAAEESIKRISEARPDIILGAGTVTSVEQVDRAVRAGAKFIVTPGYNPKVVNYCIDNSVRGGSGYGQILSCGTGRRCEDAEGTFGTVH